MKLDMELVRRFLLLIEEQEDGIFRIPEDVDVNIAKYHLNLLKDKGYINVSIFYADNIPYFINNCSLTWEGHEFLDSIRNDTIWNKVVETLKQEGSSITLEIIKSLAIKLSESLFS